MADYDRAQVNFLAFNDATPIVLGDQPRQALAGPTRIRIGVQSWIALLQRLKLNLAISEKVRLDPGGVADAHQSALVARIEGILDVASRRVWVEKRHVQVPQLGQAARCCKPYEY